MQPNNKSKKVYLFNNMTSTPISRPCIRVCKKKKTKKK